MALTDPILAASPLTIATQVREAMDDTLTGLQRYIGIYNETTMRYEPSDSINAALERANHLLVDGERRGVPVPPPVFAAAQPNRVNEASLEVVPSHSRYHTYEGSERQWMHYFVSRFRLNNIEGRDADEVEEISYAIGELLCWSVMQWMQKDSTLGGYVIHAEVEESTYPSVFASRGISDISGAEESIQPTRVRTKGREASVLFSTCVHDPNYP